MNITMVLWFLISSLSNVAAIWASTKCFEMKRSKKLYYLIVYSVWTGIVILLSGLGKPWSEFRPLASVLIPLVLAPFFLNGRKMMVSIFFVINQLLDFILDVLVCFLILVIDPDFMNINDIEEYSANRVFITIVFVMVIIPLKYIYCKLWNRIVNNKKYERINGIYLMFPIGQAVVMLGMMYQRTSSKALLGITTEMITLIGLVLLAVIDCIFLFYLSDIERNKVLKQEIERMEYAYSVEQEHYRLIESKRYEIAKIRHDLKNQLVSVKQLVKTNNSAEAEQLLCGIEKTLDDTVEYDYCSVPVINAVLQQKKQQCEQNAIAFEADISIFETGIIEPVHLCSIFSNMLDNAINANVKLTNKGRYIKLFAQNKQGHIVIHTENPTAEKGKKTIDPAQSKGYGLKILKDISEKYSGQFDISFDNNVCRVGISVCIEQ
ncbi:MAG: sensor histidine kinase [Oscillospiraceae bacterium]